MRWRLQVLGTAKVTDEHGSTVRFRGRSALRLLILLALQGRRLSRPTVEAMLWPESDPERQAQSYRRAIADLREVLEPEGCRGTLLEVDRDSIALISDRLHVDAVAFRAAAEVGLRDGLAASLAEAVDLYTGPLWPDAFDDWIPGYREQLEELFAQVVTMLSSHRVATGMAKDAVRLCRMAVLKAPLREEIHASLIEAYNADGQGVEAIRAFEALEAMLDENWGEAPSARSLAALSACPVDSVPADPPVKSSGGARSPVEPAVFQELAEASESDFRESAGRLAILAQTIESEFDGRYPARAIEAFLEHERSFRGLIESAITRPELHVPAADTAFRCRNLILATLNAVSWAEPVCMLFAEMTKVKEQAPIPTAMCAVASEMFLGSQGRSSPALPMIDQALRMLDSRSSTLDYAGALVVGAYALLNVAVGLVNQEATQLASDRLDAARRIVAEWEGPDGYFVKTHLEVAIEANSAALHRLSGKYIEAKCLLQRAMALPGFVIHRRVRPPILLGLAHNSQHLGEMGQALNWALESAQEADEMGLTSSRLQALSATVDILMYSGELDHAARSLRDAFSEVLERPQTHAVWCVIAADLMVRKGDTELARDFLQYAIDLGHPMEALSIKPETRSLLEPLPYTLRRRPVEAQRLRDLVDRIKTV